MTENKQYISDIDETGYEGRLAIWVFDTDLNDYLMFCYADETNEIVEVLNQYGKKVKLLKQFRNLANDYNIPLGKLCDAFQDCLEENEQLKNKIDALEDDNETYHKSLEKLNLYTKRFIPTKCTNEFKDCKTNRYYWLDHEGNFKGCLELLNLLDCENELLKSENRQLKGRLMVYEEQIKGDVE